MLQLDVWGPYKHCTYNGCNSFLTIVDDFTRSTWVFLLKSRTNIVNIIDQFLKFLNTHFHLKVEFIRTDNALELTEGPIKKLYLNLGILHQTSCSNTPQQNGVVERKHKHLLETARALHFQS